MGWCEDHQSALPGFELHKLYDDFTLPCFDGEHNMIMGGSFISTGDQASVNARYQFRPHFFQHASFRLSQPQEKPWLETSCMGAGGPYARDKSPFRTVFSEEPMQWDWPVIANYHEAKAFCAWRTRKDDVHDAPYRVLTEAEHHRIRDDTE